ncbi:MAG TPA: hypothetical protein VG298_05990 [Acidimicrobiales bacterium]|jgi:hypothetical protein|nr:hypothetical protein [Acidimicrobiales bacterium]
MSEVEQVDNVMSLEDLFLSHEFGKTAVDASAAVREDTLFGGTTPRAPLVPLASAPTASIGRVTGHVSTTHIRRNRTIAAVSGIAAALLVAVGLITNTGKPTSSGEHSIGPTTIPNPGGGGNSTPPVTTPPTGSSTTPGGTAGSTSGSQLASSSGRGSTVHDATGVGATATVVDVITPTGGNGGGAPVTSPTSTTTPGSPTTPATPQAKTILTPVVQLLGQVVQTTGNTVTGASTTLGGVLPPLAPVTSLLGGLGSTVSGLGTSLIVSA